jgi:hypothetical protein
MDFIERWFGFRVESLEEFLFLVVLVAIIAVIARVVFHKLR